MMSVTHYDSPLGRICLTADDIGLTGLWFEDQIRHVPRTTGDGPAIDKAIEWLDDYFDGRIPEVHVELHLIGTDFQLRVWNEIRSIPYGGTISYGEIAKRIADECGISKISAQAVGNAVGRNPIAMIVPCHRVIGSDGSMTGYAGGLERKIRLLSIEGSL